jgi:subtilisin family serine protease
VPEKAGTPLLWAVNRNRPARPALWRSRNTIKADAATLLFDLRCNDICWAIVDSGIDATHPAFGVRDADGRLTATSRVRATYDFTRLRGILAGTDADRDTLGGAAAEERKEIETRLRSGRAIDWGLLAKQLQVGPDRAGYAPQHEHGTHVAGILGADWKATDSTPPRENDVRGICPDIGIYDLRVIGDDGLGDEFAVLAALQFVRWLNANSPAPVVHGVNISLSLTHEVGSFACGRTPVCEECERLIGSGTTVVVAAGNEGRAFVAMASGASEGYRQMSITDPGNASGVITVGATHRHQPHTYGVSYFSSRGPTGDGRSKPDLVAPGEKITAPVPGGGLKSLDGTSMAAPHVSGAAALILARHPELIGQPAEVKRVLCTTATDLGRERYFQGSGVVDALRAIQSI